MPTTTRTLHPIGTISPTGWRLLITRGAKTCYSCRKPIKSNRGAWMQQTARHFDGRRYTDRLYLCQHGHEQLTQVAP